MMLVLVAAVWMFAIPIAIVVIVAVCELVDRHHDHVIERELSFLLSGDWHPGEAPPHHSLVERWHSLVERWVDAFRWALDERREHEHHLAHGRRFHG